MTLRPTLLCIWLALPLVGCVDQRPDDDDASGDDDDTGDDDDDTGDDDDTSSDDDDDTAPGTAPQAEVLAPTDGAVISTPAAVNLSGHAEDAEDGELNGAALSWSSSLDGGLGSGEQLTVPLTEGAHILTLVATDSDGRTDQDQVSVLVSGENALPVPTITSPGMGAQYFEGESVALAGAATDAEDGAIAGASLFWASSLDGSIGSGASLGWTPTSLGSHTILLTAIDSQGGQGIASVTVQVAAVGSNLPPQATIAQPTAGATYTTGDAVDLAGSASDPEDGPLSGADLSWTSSLEGALGTGEALSVTLSAPGVHTITLSALDSEGVAGADSVTITVNPPGNAAPTATIQAPADGALFYAGDPVDLIGSGADPEDGALTGAALRWSSLVDGALGDGATLAVDTLSVGPHTIQLLAEDSGGAVGVDTVDITILAANSAPSVSITTPADGSAFDAGTSIDFAGWGADPEDGSLSGPSLVWQSSQDGPMGSGEALSFGSLSVGTHTVTLTGLDSGGLSATDSVQITILPAAVNLAPVAVLVGPSVAAVGDTVTFDGAGSYDNDGSITSWSIDFGDGSPAVASATADHSYTAEGSWSITLSVTDDEGASDTATATLVTSIPVPVPEVVHDDGDHLGSRCALALDGADLPHVVYRDDTHSQLHYASYDGASWTHSLVDGPGFDVGSAITSHFDLAVTPSGVPHIAYEHADSSVWYATPGGLSWTREQVTDLYTENAGRDITIALDPTRGHSPLVLWTHVGYDYYSDDQPVVAWIDGPGTWQESRFAAAGDGDYALGGLAVDGAGVAWITYDLYDVKIAHWTPTGGFIDQGVAYASTWSSSDHVPLVFDSAGEPILMGEEGLEHHTGGIWVHSTYDAVDADYYQLATNASDHLWVGTRRFGELQLEEPTPYFDFQYQGPMDATPFDLAVDSTGKPWACFFRDGNLLVY